MAQPADLYRAKARGKLYDLVAPLFTMTDKAAAHEALLALVAKHGEQRVAQVMRIVRDDIAAGAVQEAA